jgi:hypothetical protein
MEAALKHLRAAERWHTLAVAITDAQAVLLVLKGIAMFRGAWHAALAITICFWTAVVDWHFAHRRAQEHFDWLRAREGSS